MCKSPAKEEKEKMELPLPLRKDRLKQTKWMLAIGIVAGLVFFASVAAFVLVNTGALARGNGDSEDSQSASSTSSEKNTAGEEEEELDPVTVTLVPSVEVTTATIITAEDEDETNNTTASNIFENTMLPTLAPVLAPVELINPTTPTAGAPNDPGPASEPTTPEGGTKTIFYAIGDVPYDDDQAETLDDQMRNLPQDAEFVIHVGDIRSSPEGVDCERSEYENVRDLLKQSHAPVFIILGDNDWNDCPNPDEGLAYWEENFLNFESRHWNHTFNIIHQPDYPQNFAFEHKGTLFMGLNVVGGEVKDQDEWTKRLTDEVGWLKEIVGAYVEEQAPKVGRVVLFVHANINHTHREFENPLKDFITDELENGLPIL